MRNWNNRHTDTGNCCGGWCLGLRLNLRVASTAGQEGMSHTAPGVHFRQRSDQWPVVLSMYQRGSLLDGLAMYLSLYICDTKKFHDNESTHILHNFWTSTYRGEASFPLAAPLVRRAVRCSCLPQQTAQSLLRSQSDKWLPLTYRLHQTKLYK